MSHNLALDPAKAHVEALKLEAAKLIHQRRTGAITRQAVEQVINAKNDDDREQFRHWLNHYNGRAAA